MQTIQVVSLIPIAILLHSLNRGSSLSLLITVIGLLAMLAGIAIDVGFVIELVTFGTGPIGGTGFYILEVAVLVWLLSANVLAWRSRTLPRGLALLGVASPVTASLLFPVWAISLARELNTREVKLPPGSAL